MGENSTDVPWVNSTAPASSPPFNYVLVKLHAALAIFAWICLIPCSIFVARQCKPVFSGGGRFPTWLRIHIVLFVLAVLMTIASFLCIAIPNKGYKFDAPVPGQAHQCLGLTAIAMLLIGLVVPPVSRNKPSKHAAKATWWIHYLAGNADIAIGATISVIGVMRTAGPPGLVVFPVTMVVFHGLMNELIGKCIKPPATAATIKPGDSQTQPQSPSLSEPSLSGSSTVNGTMKAEGRLHTVSDGLVESAKLSTVFLQVDSDQVANSNGIGTGMGNGGSRPQPVDIESTVSQTQLADQKLKALRVRKIIAAAYFTFIPSMAIAFALLYSLLWHPDNV